MDVEKEINKILWGRCLVKAFGSDCVSKTFTLRSLTISEQNQMDFLKDTVLQECKEDGILTGEELMSVMSETGAWTEDDDKEIEDLEREIRRLKYGIKQSEYHASKNKILSKKLKKAEFKLQTAQGEKSALLGNTADSRAEEFVRRYMIFMSATDKFGNQIWKTEEEFLLSTDSTLIDVLTLRYVENHIMSESNLREIARSGLWRFRWSASKNGESLFGKSIAEWSELQSALVYWSQFYDYVYESMDRPSEMVIANDAALDAWYSDQSKEQGSKASSLSSKNDHQEQFIVVPDGDKETIDKINNMNSNTSKDTISRERKQIKEQGSISEWDLRKGGQ
jgi:hypothetical protein